MHRPLEGVSCLIPAHVSAARGWCLCKVWPPSGRMEISLVRAGLLPLPGGDDQEDQHAAHADQ